MKTCPWPQKVHGWFILLSAFALAVSPAQALHSLGRVIPTSRTFNATSGTTFSDPGALFLILHFTSALEGGDRLIVTLSYGADEFTAASGSELWTRPIRGDSVTITYVDDGDGVGSVTLDRFGRGENVNQGTGAVPNIGNSDLFLLSSPYVNPPPRITFGICGGMPPTWQNVYCLNPAVPSQLVMSNAARSVGMFVMVHEGMVSSCSAALIGPDLILTAAHCAKSTGSVEGEEVDSGSFTLDFFTDCADNRRPGYNPKFYKLKRRVRSGFTREACDPRPDLDYAILQLDTGGASLGAPPLTMRPSAPVSGESVFVIHHPRGTTKKVGRPGLDSCVTSISSFTCDVDNGSSGSPVFDAAGNIIGVAVTAGCSSGGGNGLTSTSAILTDIASSPPPCNPLSVVTVFDRSGSMALPARTGSTQTKLQAAKAATAMFIDLLRVGAGDKIGVVPFSTTAATPAGSTLDLVTNPKKNTLIGPPPARNAGVVGGLTADQFTSIGDGLRIAQTQLSADTSGNTPAILLMTDGLQNRSPFIADVEASLGATRLCVVGFGTEASLDGPLLTRLALDHGGNYTRAGEGLELKKFFVLCFGNIFSSSSSMDPFYTLPAGATSYEPIPFRICDETMLTVVIGWENPALHLFPTLQTPRGVLLGSATPGVLSSSGDTWHYLRLHLPFAGEQSGTWKILLTNSVSLNSSERFFASTVVEGGPYFRVRNTPRRYYTGDSINPVVLLREPTGVLPEQSTVTVEVTRPLNSAGNILRQTGLGPATMVGGEPLDARTSTLSALERNLGRPLIETVTETFPLFDDTEHSDGAMEPDGVFANPLAALTSLEGNYVFHAVARYGRSCLGTREATWSVAVECGIISNLTTISVQSTTNLPNNRQLVGLRFTPRDVYGNHLGPGRVDAFAVESFPGSEPTNSVRDVGDGSYIQDVVWTPSAFSRPGLVLTQSGRTPVGLTTSPAISSSHPPVVAIVSPVDNQVFPAQQNLSITAAAFDPDNTIPSVQFFVDQTFLGQRTSPPYSVVWSNPPPGSHVLTAVANDSNSPNLRGTSGPVRISVTTNLAEVDLALAKLDAPDPVKVEANLTYTLVVENNGSQSATDVTLTDLLPAGTRYCGATPSQGICALVDGRIQCALGTLAPGASAIVTLVVVPTETGRVTNSAVVTAREGETNFANNTAFASTRVYLTDPLVQISRTGNQVKISWIPPEGILQQTDNLNGPWTNLSNVPNPFVFNLDPNTPRSFYRVKLE
jgi:uncharacterized repeat protein (TIGR01451 family)